MKKISLLLCCVCMLCACTLNNNGTAANGTIPEDSLVQKYENDYFSVMYPQNWTAQWKDNDPGSVEVANLLDSLGKKGGSVELWSPDKRLGVRLVKSSYAWVYPEGTPKDWCELSSVQRMNEENCIGMSDVTDSLTIAGYPAAGIDFACVNGADTTVQTLFAIVPKPEELYYATIMFPIDDEKAFDLGLKMLQTLQLKVK